MTDKKKADPQRVAALKNILARMPGNGIAVQRERIVTALHELGSLATVEAMRYLDIYDSRARIHELRNKHGYQIETVMRSEQTESGVFHRIGVYIPTPRTARKA